MITQDRITILAEEAVQDTDLFLVEVRLKPSNVIEVFVDSDSAVSIDQCVAVSRAIESKLDRDAEDFELSVLSYGLSGVLKMDRQLRKYVGREVEVKTKEQGKFQGTLLSFGDTTVEVVPAPKKASKKKPVEAPTPLVLDRKTTELKPAIVF